MLQFSRVPGETVKIGDGVELVVVSVENGKVTLALKTQIQQSSKFEDHGFDDTIDMPSCGTAA